jgi:hypothetical protein
VSTVPIDYGVGIIVWDSLVLASLIWSTTTVALGLATKRAVTFRDELKALLVLHGLVIWYELLFMPYIRHNNYANCNQAFVH